jgi:hypothetical protein
MEEEKKKYCKEALVSVWLAAASALCLLLTPINIVLGIAAVITGIIGLVKIKKNPELNGKVHAIIGTIIGSVLIIITAIGIIIFFIGNIGY